MPLQKWLQWQGAGSRNDVRHAIAEGRVLCNGSRVTRFAHPVGPTDHVTLDGRAIVEQPERVVLLLHKPRRHLTALHTDDGTPHLGSYVPADAPRVFCVGRLDFNTEGALLLTNDGGLARRVLDPSHALPKVYRVKVRGHLAANDPGLQRIRDGLVHDGTAFRPAPCAIECYRTRATWVRLILTEGRFREIRRMCATNGWQIVKLQRIAIGPIELGALRPRCTRVVTPCELEALERTLADCDPSGAPEDYVAAWLHAASQGEPAREA
jgi:23S rRNA pseudouridine2605 synthase